jgi:predicted secreted Zn-dependent protease
MVRAKNAMPYPGNAMILKNGLVLLTATAGFVLAASSAQAGGRTIEQEKPYAITGASGAELYSSIGQNGPAVGSSGRRVIAHTFFTLTWSRNYVPQGGGCTLVSATPKLTITYTLPKPANALAPAVQKRWDVFIDGIRRHEKVHGDHMKAMLKRIEATTIGVSVPNDPGCQKIRKQIQTPLSEASLAQRQESSEFDRVEMGPGGNIQRLVLGLVNGD